MRGILLTKHAAGSGGHTPSPLKTREREPGAPKHGAREHDLTVGCISVCTRSLSRPRSCAVEEKFARVADVEPLIEVAARCRDRQQEATHPPGILVEGHELQLL